MLFQQEVLLNWFWYFVEHYLLKIFYWYLLVGNFVICFWINLVFKIFTFDTCFSFDLICLFWVNSVYLLYCFSRKFFSIGIDIKVWYLVEYYLLKMFHWYLLLGNFVICFWINLVFEIDFDTCFSFDLICLFWVNSVYLLCCFSRKFFSIGIDIKFDIWLNIIYPRCFIDIFC